MLASAELGRLRDVRGLLLRLVGGEGKKRGCGTWVGGDPADSVAPHDGLDDV